LSLPLAEIIQEQQARHGLQILPVTPEQIYALSGLPLHHKDPFDRLLIAQALMEGLPIARVDSAFSASPISLVW
jgi:PIN domain nuclease of toxin-antitoxin system